MSVFVIVSEASRRWAHELDDRFERWRESHQLITLPPAKKLARMNPAQLREVLDNQIISHQDLAELKLEISTILTDINQTIEIAKQEAKLGNWLPPKEFRALESQRKLFGAKIVAIETALVKSKRRLKRHRPLPEFFMEVAEEMLDHDLYFKLKGIALKRQGEAKNQ